MVKSRRWASSSIEPKILSRSNAPFCPRLGGRTVAFTAFMMTTKRCHFDNFQAKHHVRPGGNDAPPDGNCGIISVPDPVLRWWSRRNPSAFCRAEGRGRRRRPGRLHSPLFSLYSTLRAFSLISLREIACCSRRIVVICGRATACSASLSSRLNTLRQKLATRVKIAHLGSVAH